MRAVFKHILPLRSDEVSLLWDLALFVPDTNFLLDLYRSSSSTTNDVLGIFSGLKERLRLSHQVGIEYFRNLKEAQAKIPSLLDAINGSLDAASTALGTDLKKLRDANPDLNLDEAGRMQEAVKTALAQIKKEALARQNNDRTRSHKSTEVAIEQIFATPLPSVALLPMLGDAERRYQNKIPPGFKDATKGENKYGDLLIWSEMIALATREKKPIFFVTRDLKEDWWRNGVPHISLRQEFYDLSGQQFWMLNPPEFLRIARQKGVGSVDNTTITEVTAFDTALFLRDPLSMGETREDFELNRQRAIDITNASINTALKAAETVGSHLPIQDSHGRHVAKRGYYFGTVAPLSQQLRNLTELSYDRFVVQRQEIQNRQREFERRTAEQRAAWSRETS